MLKDSQVEQIVEKVLVLLTDMGVVVENDQVVAQCLDAGCRQGPDGRVRIPSQIIEEMVAFHRPAQDEYERNHDLIHTCGPDWAHHLTWTGGQDAFRDRYRESFLMQAFDCGPTTYYDHGDEQVRPVDGEVFDRMMKLAEATPEIGYTSMWYRQDLPPMIERLTSLRRAMDLTGKFAGIEAIYPEVVKYLKEASEILTGDPASSTYLAGSECMTSPLILEQRSAEDILARRDAGVHRHHVASMPTLGVSTPVTLAGSVVMGAAEILGGMAVCWCVDPESNISGRMITLIADMRNGNSTSFCPAHVQFNNAVRQLFMAKWGGHCMVEVIFSPTARRPGLQAVFENWFATSCRQRWDSNPDIPYGGMGTLHNGGLGSPTQFMLDMEIRRGQWACKHEIEVSEDTLDFDEILQVTQQKGNFLMSDHTVAHCHDLWTSDYFLSDSPFVGDWDGTEKTVLDRCDQAWRANLAKWEPPTVWSDDQKKAMDGLLARARNEFEIG